MNEGISLLNIKQVHILDVYFNLNRVDQVVGRGIRQCSHYNVTNKNRKPIVEVFKYIVGVTNGSSTEEEMYRKAEFKYQLVKKVERVLKEVAIDCPLNMSGNIFKEELEKYKNCNKPGKIKCPAICDYTNCDYKCDGNIINKYYDPKRKLYQKIKKEKLDYTTFNFELANNEINYCKKKIKEMYRIKYLYTLEQILNYIKDSHFGEKKELFDPFFVYKALDSLIPITENDFNNFKDSIIDKYSKEGYLIYIDEYYIFQPFDQNEDVPMSYRVTFDKELHNKISIYNYVKNKDDSLNDSNLEESLEKEEVKSIYDFESVLEYYDSRPEFKFVGIIDSESVIKKNLSVDKVNDVFKIREKRNKILEKKRGTGIPSLKGAVCSTSKSREYLQSICKKINIKLEKNITRSSICELIKK